MASDFQIDRTILNAVGMADTPGGTWNLEELAHESGLTSQVIADRIERLERWGLMLLGPSGIEPPMLLDAGRQYLHAGGQVHEDVLSFLPSVIDDLVARDALLRGGAILVDEFRGALLNRHGAAHAAELVPPAFAQAIDEPLALDLFAAAVALLARLSADQAPGCVAEEILVVALIGQAEGWILTLLDRGEIDPPVADNASECLRGIFELHDADVLGLFDMEEPGDAAVAEHDPANQTMGVADQRVESWFSPFGGVAPTGHLISHRR